jgi:hypothetical protein
MYRTSCSEGAQGQTPSPVARTQRPYLFRLDPLVLGQRLVQDGLLDGGPESERSVVGLFGCESTDGL